MLFPSILLWMEGTKEIFAEAFRRLKVNNPSGKITVKRIAEEAGFDRHTFYYHFSCIDDLVSWIIDAKLLTLFENDDVTWEDVIHSAIAVFMDDSWFELATRINEDTYSMLIRKIAPIIEKDIRGREDIARLHDKDIHLISSSAVWAITGAFYSWLSDPDWRKERNMAEKLIKLVRHYIDEGIAVFS